MWDNLKDKNLMRYKFNLKRKEGRTLAVGEGLFGLKALETGFISQKEIKSISFFARKFLKKTGRIHFNCVPNYLSTKKPIETRMGKGKGGKDFHAIFVPAGRVFVEVLAANNKAALYTLDQIQKKLRIRTVVLPFVF